MGGAGSNELQTAQRRPQLRKHQRSQLVVDQVLVGSATGAAPAVVAVWICHTSEVRRELGTNLSLRDSVVLQHINKDMGSNMTIGASFRAASHASLQRTFKYRRRTANTICSWKKPSMPATAKQRATSRHHKRNTSAQHGKHAAPCPLTVLSLAHRLQVQLQAAV